MADVLRIISFGQSTPPLLASAVPPFPNRHIQHGRHSSEDGGDSGDDGDDDDDDDDAGWTLDNVARQVAKAKRIAVVCGAGISCASGIPDFRSSEGLFQSLKRQHPEAKLGSGKDLFDASLFQSEQNTSIFYNMIAELKNMADEAQPTAVHRFLKALDDQGKLFRVYTQNIDALEEKAGLSYGLGDMSLPLPPRRGSRSPSKARAASTSGTATPSSSQPSTSDAAAAVNDSVYPYPSPAPSPPPDSSPTLAIASTSSLPAPAPTHATIPRCIPLHGHLKTLTCFHCNTTVPIEPHLPSLSAGSTIPCPSCLVVDAARSSRGARSRGVGRLRPDVVLYGEPHRDGDRVGQITQRDLMSAPRPDLLLVVGTSLKVPGTKRLVRELAKVIRPGWEWVPANAGDEGERDATEEGDMLPPPPTSSAQSTTSSTARSRRASSKAKVKAKLPPLHALYLNYDFPRPAAEWRDVFDVWVRGDAQAFVGLVEEEAEKMLKTGHGNSSSGKLSAVAKGKKKATAAAAAVEVDMNAGANGETKMSGKAKAKGKTKSIGGAAAPRNTARAKTTVGASSLVMTPASATYSSSSRSKSRKTTVPNGKITVRNTAAKPLTLQFAVTKASVANVTGTGVKGAAAAATLCGRIASTGGGSESGDELQLGSGLSVTTANEGGTRSLRSRKSLSA